MRAGLTSMLVSGGVHRLHRNGSLSTPITATSSGTRSSARRHASSTWWPRSSWQVMIPTGFGSVASHRAICLLLLLPVGPAVPRRPSPRYTSQSQPLGRAMSDEVVAPQVLVGILAARRAAEGEVAAGRSSTGARTPAWPPADCRRR